MTDAACASRRAGRLAPAGLRTWLSDRRIGSGVVLAATILATVLSFAFIGQKSLWIDEASSIHIARDWSQMWRSLLTEDSNMWLYYLLLHWWYTGVRKDDWRAVTAFVQSRAQPGDAAAFYWYTSIRPFQYYLARTRAEHPPPAVLDLAPPAAKRRHNRRELDTQLLERLPATHDRVWLILQADTAFRDLRDRSIIFDCLQARYTCAFEQDFPGIRILLFPKSPQ